MKPNEMPVVQAIPIPTKRVPYPKAVLNWIFTKRKWRLTRSWYFNYTEKNGNIVKLAVPKDYIFDGASIPRPFWFILSPVGLLFIPGLLHDFAFEYNMLWQIKNKKAVKYKPGSKKHVWDWMFRRVAIQVNGFYIINTIAWFFLYIGSGFHWWWYRRKGLKAPKLVI